MNNIMIAQNRVAFRQWLEENSQTSDECWLLLKRGKPKLDGTFAYLDAVEEALCFGWIDSKVKKTAEYGTLQRFTPRKPKSNWTELNKSRCRRLARLGLMTPMGEKVLPDMNILSFKIDEELYTLLIQDLSVWEQFKKFPDLYQRVRIDNIQSYKKNTEIFLKKANKLIEETRKGKLFGDWNDYGRLEDSD